jgi:hypothetical protein
LWCTQSTSLAISNIVVVIGPSKSNWSMDTRITTAMPECGSSTTNQTRQVIVGIDDGNAIKLSYIIAISTTTATATATFANSICSVAGINKQCHIVNNNNHASTINIKLTIKNINIVFGRYHSYYSCSINTEA